MKILDQSVYNDIDQKKLLRLNLGAGSSDRKGFYGVDMISLPGIAIQADLNEPLGEIPDNSVGSIVSYQCFEHISNFLPMMKELHRILHPSGSIEIEVPHFSNPYAYSDPTHVRFFGLYTMFYFSTLEDQPERKVPPLHIKERFRVSYVWIHLLPRPFLMRCLFPFMNKLINSSFKWQERYERWLCRMLPAWSITYRMTPVK